MPVTFHLLLFFFSQRLEVLYNYFLVCLLSSASPGHLCLLRLPLTWYFLFRPLAAGMYEMPYFPLCLECIWKRVNFFSALQVCSLCHSLLLLVFCFLHNWHGATCCCLVRGWLQVFVCVFMLPYFACHTLMQKQPAAAAKESALFQFPVFPLLSCRKGRNHIGKDLWIH